MLKIFLMAVILVFLTTLAWASPHLVCDVPPVSDNVTGCDVEVDGIVYPGSCLTTGSSPMVCGDGSCYELIDIGFLSLGPGQHIFRARFSNLLGPGEWSDPYVAGKPGVPGNVRAK